MVIIPGYSVLDTLSSTTSSTVYRGSADLDNSPVIIKISGSESPSPSPAELAKTKWEYEVTSELDLDGVVRPLKLIPFKHGYALILEDFGGTSLRAIMAGQQIDLATGLQISLSLAQTLGLIHQKGIIHKDIKPSNIIVNQETGAVKLSDFSIASRISGEKQAGVTPDLLEGTLAYISPEQTGRMNRSIDHRTDLYSLGVTMYEMFTGVLPFDSTDKGELIHCHMAVPPRPPRKLDNSIPAALSNLIMKLLAKNAENRYRSAFGIVQDLKECVKQLKSRGEIQDFVLGKMDIPTFLQIPENLYGREKELALLISAFTRAARGGTEMMLVRGSPGVGKSVLVNELQKPVIEQRGYFTVGKFDQFKRNVPYSALRQAFKDICRQLLCERTEMIADWQEKIRAALGPNGRIIVELIPEMELIIGAQPPVEILPPTQSQNRFNMVFIEFVKVFARREHPLVLFLDDVQWANWATLKLVEQLVAAPDLNYLLLIMAFRDSEIGPGHPLQLTLDDILSAGTVVNEITLPPLPESAVAELIYDTLVCTRSDAEILAETVMTKTHGNPFFVNQFLRDLYQRQIIRFDPETRSWTWDAAAIRKAKITDNVVEFMCEKIRRLSPAALETLTISSCLGSKFDLGLLAQVGKTSAAAAAAALQESQHEGLLISIDASYKYVETLPEDHFQDRTAPETMITYMFQHDRIRQAAYSLISEDRKMELNRLVGRILLQGTPAAEKGEKLFEIVQHLNPGSDRITSRTEKIELAGLNLAACKKAKGANAYDTALQFAVKGIDLLGKNAWQDDYQLHHDLLMERAECEYLTGNFDQAEAVLASLLENVRSNEEKARIYNSKAIIYAHLGKPMETILAGLGGLYLLGMDLPENPGKLNIFLEFGKAFLRLRGRKPNNLLNLPEMTDPRQQLAIRLLMNTISSAYLSDQDMFAFLCLKGFNLTLQYGVTESSPYMFNSYAFAWADNFGAFKYAYDFSMAAFSLNDRLPNTLMRSKTTALFAFFFSHWRDPLPQGIDMVKKAFGYCVEAGDFVFAGYSSCTLSLYLLAQGRNIDEHLNELKSYQAFGERGGDNFSIDFHNLKNQFFKNLKGRTRDGLSLSDDGFDEAKALQGYREQHNANLLFHYHSWKGLALYLQGEFSEAARTFEAGNHYAHGVALLPSVADHIFYFTLALTASYLDMTFVERWRNRKIMNRNLKKMARWTANCPENFEHKYLLVKAEMAKIKLNEVLAAYLYNRAITSARENGFVQVEALANELMADFHLMFGRKADGRTYIREACRCYRKWGAVAKARSLSEEHGFEYRADDHPAAPAGKKTEGRKEETSVSSGTVREIDLATVLRSSQAISEEIVLSNLLKEIMRVVIQNAGAQKGFLILEKDGWFFIEAEGHIDKENVEVLQSIPVEPSSELSAGIVNYVRRTQETVVLQNASEEGLFVSDPYVVENQSKSILCLPIVKQKKLTGILYLENNLLHNAFTDDRIEILSLLASQAAISLENAKLYEDVEQRVILLQQSEDEQRRLYSQLLQAQKMEAVGRLAGGVAHDFNNILTSILGYSQIIKMKLPDDHPLKEKAENIYTSGLKAAALTRQLLTFSRKQAMEMRVVNLNLIIKDMGKMLKRLIGEDIEIDLKVDGPVGNISGDPGQLEQILMNLAVNARDAMPCGGLLTVETGEKYLDEEYARYHEDIEPGLHILLRVSDNGEGIAPEVKEKIFEPFFTTKAEGKGTGLGLSTVFGIVKQHHGHIEVKSAIGCGTTFTIYLPVVEGKADKTSQPIEKKEFMPRGSETILIVDDDSSVRRLIIDTLEPLGYHLLEAGCGTEALELAKSFSSKINLILTDVIMPGMNGIELIKILKPMRPEIRVVFMSGYTDIDIAPEGGWKPGMTFIRKPLTPTWLAKKLREELDAPEET